MRYSIHIILCLFGILACKNSNADSSTTLESSDVKDITIEEAVNLMTTPGYTTYDVRKPSEIAEGKILNSAKELDFYSDDFKSELEELDKNGKYIMYCRSGGRSGKTLKMMKDMGFKHAYNVLGGMKGYREKYGAEPVAE